MLIAQTNDIEDVKEIPYGVNYIIKGLIKLPNRRAVAIKTVWFIAKQETSHRRIIESGKISPPRFVTAIPVIIPKD